MTHTPTAAPPPITEAQTKEFWIKFDLGHFPPPIRFTHAQALQASLSAHKIPLGELVKLNPKFLK